MLKELTFCKVNLGIYRGSPIRKILIQLVYIIKSHFANFDIQNSYIACFFRVIVWMDSEKYPNLEPNDLTKKDESTIIQIFLKKPVSYFGYFFPIRPDLR